MPHDTVTFSFPVWLRCAHWVNFLLLTLLVRSGIQILADHPRLYWTVHTKPGREWLKFTSKVPATDRIWTSMDEAVHVSPWIAIPGGRHNLGLGRHWHFLCVIFWVLNGFIYVGLLFGTGEWQRLLPASWDIVPRAFHTALTYLTFHLPDASEFRPYDPLQQLAYSFVVFIMAPLSIATGMAMSPAVVAHWPWYHRLFGNRQVARSIHFLLMTGYLAFFVVHVTLVVLTGFARNMNHIVLGVSGDGTLGARIGLGIVAFVIFLNWLLTWTSRKWPRLVQDTTGLLTDGAMALLLNRLRSRQTYNLSDVSDYFWVNGLPPETAEFQELLRTNFKDWRLKVHGLVDGPISFSLEDLKAMPKVTMVTMHNCIQGWSSIGEWGGVPLKDIILRCKPAPDARYIIFHSYGVDEEGREYYGSLALDEAMHPQTILAYEFNGGPLPPERGAPLRLRVETKLGFKMVKYLKSIEFVQDYRTVGLGHGGYREDTQFFGTLANI